MQGGMFVHPDDLPNGYHGDDTIRHTDKIMLRNKKIIRSKLGKSHKLFLSFFQDHFWISEFGQRVDHRTHVGKTDIKKRSDDVVDRMRRKDDHQNKQHYSGSVMIVRFVEIERGKTAFDAVFGPAEIPGK